MDLWGKIGAIINKKFYLTFYKKMVNKFSELKEYEYNISDKSLDLYDPETGEVYGLTIENDKVNNHWPNLKMDKFSRDILETFGYEPSSFKRKKKKIPKEKIPLKERKKFRPKVIEKKYQKIVKDLADSVVQVAKDGFSDLETAASESASSFLGDPVVERYFEIKEIRDSVAIEIFADDIYDEALKIYKKMK